MVTPARRRSTRRSRSIALGLVLLIPAGLSIGLAAPASALAVDPGLKTAADFAILAGSGITNTGPTTVGGDIGTHPTPAVTGKESITVTGVYHEADEVASVAKTDLGTAYANAAGQARDADSSAELGGQTLVPGVYGTDGPLGLTGTLVLDGQGRTDGIWVFQTGSTLTTASASKVTLVNGATACNVYWQVGSSATLGTSTAFQGSVLAAMSISATTGATIEGRLLAQSGAVTLDTNTVTVPVCTASVVPPPEETPVETPVSPAPVSPAPVSPAPVGDTPDASPAPSPSPAVEGSPAPTAPVTTAPPAAAAPVAYRTSPVTSRRLPVTGASSQEVALSGAALVVLGLGLLRAVAARRAD